MAGRARISPQTQMPNMIRFLTMAAGFLALAIPAGAADWSLRSTISERGSINDNPDLDVNSPGWVFGSLTSLGVNLAAESHVYRFGLNGNWSYRKYFGQNADDISDDAVNLPSLNASFVRQWKRTTWSTAASYVLQNTTEGNSSTIGETDSTGGNVWRQSVAASSSVSHTVDALNSVAWSVNVGSVDFFDVGDADVDPNKTIGTSVSWTQRQTKRTDFTYSAGVDWYDYQNDTNTTNYVYYGRLDVSHVFNPRFRIYGGAGARAVNTFEDDRTGSRDSRWNMGGLADLGFEYTLKTLVMSGGLSYGVTPDDNGFLQNSLTANLAANYRVNDTSNTGITVALRTGNSIDSDFFVEKTLSISPYYSWNITPYWDLRASYQFVLQEDGGNNNNNGGGGSNNNNENGTAIQNAAFLTITRRFDLIP